MSNPVEQEKERVTGIFDRSAATYDRVGPRFFSYFGQRLVEAASLVPGARVLDIAAGRGAVLFPAAELVGEHGRVVGIDLSYDMVEETSTEIRRRGLENVEIRRMDAEQLEFPDATFDHALCGFALWFFPNPATALREIRRVLKPGGSLALTTWAKDSPAPELARAVVRPFLPPGASGSNRQGAPLFNTVAQMQTALSEAGLENTRVYAEEHDFIYKSLEDWWATLWSTGMRAYLETLTPDTLQQAKLAGAKVLEAYRQDDGIHIVHRALLGFCVKPSSA